MDSGHSIEVTLTKQRGGKLVDRDYLFEACESAMLTWQLFGIALHHVGLLDRCDIVIGLAVKLALN